MKAYKLKVVDEMERMANEFHSFFLRTAALNTGLKHLKTQECHEIIRVFLNRCPDYKSYRLDQDGYPPASFFVSVFVTDNETPPHELYES